MSEKISAENQGPGVLKGMGQNSSYFIGFPIIINIKKNIG